MNKIINKIVRRFFLNDNDTAQLLGGQVLGGEANMQMTPVMRQAAADGCVLLKNNGILPLSKNSNVAVFGRVQYDYFNVGNGSGGDVCPAYKQNIIDSMDSCEDITVNKAVKEKYINWCTNPRNVPDPGFWGNWPRYYEEMPLDDGFVQTAAQQSDCAVVVIGRSAGEDRENILKPGSYYLTKKEIKMLDKVTEYFDKVALLLNIGSIMDFSQIELYGDKIGALMIVWQGGMESGGAVCDVLSGKVNPSGRLTDTIAKYYKDYPGADNFGGKKQNCYVEDIYAGYRYFETFAPDKVLYEFGFGLSYTDFDIKYTGGSFDGDNLRINAAVTNTGAVSGKEVVQLYAACPMGKLGKAAKSLIAFDKTKLLSPGESQNIEFIVDKYAFSSYDDSGVTEHKNCYVLENGEYSFYIGKSVRNCSKVYSFNIDKTIVVKQFEEVMAVPAGSSFARFVPRERPGGYAVGYENVPCSTVNLHDLILSQLPDGRDITNDLGYKLSDVKSGRVSMSDFVSQLSLDELELITRGEGCMDSQLGEKGNAGIIGGVSQSLRSKGIPPMTATDGPSGIRLRKSCSLLPSGTCLACTWDAELVRLMYDAMGKEMIDRGSDILLAPGMNIHRNPLCGRNFEYFSEDPLISGKMACAVVNGIQKNGVSACPKHFACNNQEYNRTYNNSVVSQRALREIYLKGFEICVKESKPLNIMTSYNKINGVWSHYNYQLCTTVLRQEWGYTGAVMTDWWMRYAPSPEFPSISGNAYRVRAQVDVLMPGGKTAVSKSAPPDGTLLATYNTPEGITLGEMQRCAQNVLNYIIKTNKDLS